jgi:hypothetical protein
LKKIDFVVLILKMEEIIGENRNLIKHVIVNLDYDKDYTKKIVLSIVIEIMKTKKFMGSLTRISKYHIYQNKNNLETIINYIFQQYLHLHKITNLSNRIKKIEQIVLKK